MGPSGSGKSSVMMGLKNTHPDYVYPLSATTRPMRPGEKDGDIYHFLTREAFEAGIKNEAFLEYAVVHQDNYYGLIKQPVMDALEAGKTVVREVDIQGFDNIRDKVDKSQMVSIFITASNITELTERIKARSDMPQAELSKRITSMKKEFARARDCDFLVENRQGELEATIQKVAEIIAKEMGRQ